jgi:fatty acyl-CoA reductase
MSKAYNQSLIEEFFRDKSVLITGATGLVGKVLAFKILLSIESVKNVYLLIRDKNSKTFEERFVNLITKSRDLFTNLNKQTIEKLVPINGDTSFVGLGLNEKDRNTLVNNVSIVFHSAADITFEANLK